MPLRLSRENISDARLLGIIGPSVIALIAGSVVIGRAFLARTDAWLLGDWLIDYSAGFSRRGLVGEIVRQVAGTLSVDRIVVTVAIVWLVFVALVCVVAVLFLHHRRGLTTVLLLVSPAFLFFFLNFLGTMRKELLLFLLVGVVLLVTRNPQRSAWVWLLVGVFPLLVFAHEGLAVYGGFVLIIIYLLYSDGAVSKKQAIAQSSVVTVFTALAGWAIIFFGSSPGIDERICSNLVEEGYSRRLCGGAIAFLDRDAGEAVERVAGFVATGNYLTTYAIVAVLAAIPFLFVRFSTTLGIMLTIASAAIIPLFVFAIDWGRWMVVAVWLVTLITIRFDGSHHIQVKSLAPKTFAIDLALALAIIAYATLWSVPHCCEPRVGFGLIDRAVELMLYVGGR